MATSNKPVPSIAMQCVYVATRKRATCTLTGALLADGTEVVRYQNDKLKADNRWQYATVEAWEMEHAADTAADVVTGTPAQHGCQFQIIFEGYIPSSVMIDIITPNGIQPVWYRTSEGACSPRYCQARWQERLAAMERGGVRNGAIIVRLWYNGVYIGQRKMAWAERNQLGRFKKALANRNATLKMVQEFKLETLTSLR